MSLCQMKGQICHISRRSSGLKTTSLRAAEIQDCEGFSVNDTRMWCCSALANLSLCLPTAKLHMLKAVQVCPNAGSLALPSWRMLMTVVKVCSYGMCGWQAGQDGARSGRALSCLPHHLRTLLLMQRWPLALLVQLPQQLPQHLLSDQLQRIHALWR